MKYGGCVYFITNKSHKVLYLGVTSDLQRRTIEHREHHRKGSFSDRYNTEKLVYFEWFDRIESAIAREKELKKWRRQKKEQLINALNPEWKDLWEEVKEW